jgi:dynein heavy chain
MTGLFLRMTNEMITCCKRFLNGGAKAVNPAVIWQRDPAELIASFRACIDLMNAYKREYGSTKEKLAQMPKGRQFNFDESAIFTRFQIFVKRLEKLVDMFSSLQQYLMLKDSEVDGMEELVLEYGNLLTGFQKKNHDLFDFENTVFERDFVEFMMKNSEIESNIQV